MRQHTPLGRALILIAATSTLIACSGSESTAPLPSVTPPAAPQPPEPPPEETPEITRVHDERVFTPAADVSFEAQAGAQAFFGVYEGIQGEAVYSAEIPDTWNGGLVMYTHGFRGNGETLTVSIPDPAWRGTVLGAGYAWAASSFSANYYDVRAGVEDTNRLAIEVMDYIERDFGQRFDEPGQRLISGYSMGGHIAAAAVEREARDSARFRVDYAGAAPFCQSEQNQFQWLGDYPLLAQTLAGLGDRPREDFPSLAPQIIGTLFELDDDNNPTWVPANAEGERLRQAATQLTGGERPIFADFGFVQNTWQQAVLSTGGADGTIDGILAGNIYDNQQRQYRFRRGGEPQADAQDLNDRIERVAADDNVNALREDGVRWLPLVNGEFDVPVLTLHTLGDFYVPFRHQQLYRERALDSGAEDLLVQRAIRAPGHCDFTGTEIVTALSDWLRWVNGGPTPAGDEVLDAEVVADADYGCAFTANDGTRDRSALPACSAP